MDANGMWGYITLAALCIGGFVAAQLGYFAH